MPLIMSHRPAPPRPTAGNPLRQAIDLYEQGHRNQWIEITGEQHEHFINVLPPRKAVNVNPYRRAIAFMLGEPYDEGIYAVFYPLLIEDRTGEIHLRFFVKHDHVNNFQNGLNGLYASEIRFQLRNV